MVREMIRRSGYTPAPDEIAQTPKDEYRDAVAALGDDDPNRRFVVKSHNAISGMTSEMIAIVPFRDPRDATMSLARFTQAEGASFRVLVERFIQAYVQAHALPEDQRVLFRYSDMLRAPADVARALGQCLGLPDREDWAEIAEKFSRANVKRIAEQARGAIAGTPVEREPKAHRRMIDPQTGFQTNHITGYVDGDWRKMVSSAEQAEVAQLFGDWFEAAGLPRA